MNTFLPLGSDDTSGSGVGLVAFKLFLIAAMWRGASVETIINVVLIGGLVAVVLSLLLKARAGAKARSGAADSARRSPDPVTPSPLVTAGRTTCAGCGRLAGAEEAPSAPTSASSEEEEAQEALAHLARLERQRYASWSHHARHE